IRTKKAIKLAPVHVEVQTVHGAEISEPSSQSVGFNGASHCWPKASGSSREMRLAFLPRVAVASFASIERSPGNSRSPPDKREKTTLTMPQQPDENAGDDGNSQVDLQGLSHRRRSRMRRDQGMRDGAV